MSLDVAARCVNDRDIEASSSDEVDIKAPDGANGASNIGESSALDAKSSSLPVPQDDSDEAVDADNAPEGQAAPAPAPDDSQSKGEDVVVHHDSMASSGAVTLIASLLGTRRLEEDGGLELLSVPRAGADEEDDDSTTTTTSTSTPSTTTSLKNLHEQYWALTGIIIR